MNALPSGYASVECSRAADALSTCSAEESSIVRSHSGSSSGRTCPHCPADSVHAECPLAQTLSQRSGRSISQRSPLENRPYADAVRFRLVHLAVGRKSGCVRGARVDGRRSEAHRSFGGQRILSAALEAPGGIGACTFAIQRGSEWSSRECLGSSIRLGFALPRGGCDPLARKRAD